MSIVEKIPGVSQINSVLTGAPDALLTFLLLMIGIIAITAAVTAPPAVKAGMFAWLAFP